MATRYKLPKIPVDASIAITAAKTLTVPLDASVSGTNTGDNTVATALTGTPDITVGKITTTGNIELGHASDTTISRSGAGTVQIEGATILTTATGTNSIISNETPTGDLDGADVTYTLANSPIAGTLKLYLNGQRLTYTTDYTLATNVITFVTAPISTDLIRADYELAGAATGNADTLDNYHASSFHLEAEKAAGSDVTTGTNDAKHVTAKALADATVGKLGAAWASWSPSYANLTVGAGGAVVAKYVQIGKTIHFKFKFTWGTGSGFSAGSNITISFPVTAASDYLQYGMIGRCTSYDSGSGVYINSDVVFVSTTTMTPYSQTISGSNLILQQINNTTPFTWATGDVLWIEGTYEVA